MDNFEKKLIIALKQLLRELQFNNQFKIKDLKTLSFNFVFGVSGIKMPYEDAKKEVSKLIKSDKITIFGGLYSKFKQSSKERELIDDYLENISLFRYITIGLPEEK